MAILSLAFRSMWTSTESHGEQCTMWRFGRSQDPTHHISLWCTQGQAASKGKEYRTIRLPFNGIEQPHRQQCCVDAGVLPDPGECRVAGQGLERRFAGVG